MNTRVNQDLALLLQSKGYNELCTHYYNKKGLQQHFLENGSSSDVEFRVEYEDLLENFNDGSYYSSRSVCSAPTIAEVVMWLYEKHGIWIECTRLKDKKVFDCTIEYEQVTKLYASPTEAYEAAIEYVLLNELT
jgi:hypothetical protein